ncbi:hypothetical protein Psal006b_02921 [Piscirickettsia salmonis]|uniref:Uncharacterized protein n=1 Tax=Piscirickettsia salmonis TaxID=1238 RepID=A0A1L6TGD8_PISSA|nr:hypothetical protein [Piscirickettsia salmonis]AKP72866.2 hypothetical protein PSLF89_778 [Piscirickettsia salmonis LF-89 = ATCC VR-1361]ALB21485.1 hypothetical protein KU39_301 [Piscirickettsia salmonis]ALY01707.1 hypothetical protein AWE47_01500 [Piscirickettsia salmonis]AMA41223.1 hypothetical protein AWJ11_01510 [Piscirickettsia salmonis]AOS36412.1 hypothetical protein AVM72_14495 [Piscirickettsia salmonis]
MKKNTITTMLASAIFASATFIAYAENPPTAHTTHNITVNNSSKWYVKIVGISPFQPAYFIDQTNNVYSSELNYTLSKGNSAQYAFAFSFNGSTDFNVAYTITAIDTSQSADADQKKTKSCTFIVGANGPADPNIHVENYQGAQCSYQVIAGKGENFTLN